MENAANREQVRRTEAVTAQLKGDCKTPKVQKTQDGGQWKSIPEKGL